MYTQTGYDASAHIAEETRGAAIAAAQGVWQSVVLLGADRLVRAAGAHLRRDATSTPSTPAAAARSRSSPPRMSSWAAEARDPDRDRRPALLRHGLPDQRARARGTRSRATAPCRAGRCSGALNHQRVPVATRCSAVSLVRADHHASRRCGATRRASRSRSSRSTGDLHRRPLPRLRHPGVPALAHGRQLRARARGPSGTSYKWINLGRDRLRDRHGDLLSTCRSRTRRCRGTATSTRPRSTTRRWCILVGLHRRRLVAGARQKNKYNGPVRQIELDDGSARGDRARAAAARGAGLASGASAR